VRRIDELIVNPSLVPFLDLYVAEFFDATATDPGATLPQSLFQILPVTSSSS
jgi:hypothetical protein